VCKEITWNKQEKEEEDRTHFPHTTLLQEGYFFRENARGTMEALG